LVNEADVDKVAAEGKIIEDCRRFDGNIEHAAL